ncbi:MAG: hypothetical protein Q9161_002347 [Pseudevernia consocians]
MQRFLARERKGIPSQARHHPTSSCVAPSCKAEANVQTCWAAKHGFGPKVLAIDEESWGFVMESIKGRTLTMEMTKQRLRQAQAVKMLRRIHEVEAVSWMRMYDPMEIVSEHLECVKERNAMRPQDVRFVEDMIHDTEQKVRGHPWMSCQNDFHSHNILLRRACRNDSECLLAIDFEKGDLGDPMWDLAYLTVNLELKRER